MLLYVRFFTFTLLLYYLTFILYYFEITCAIQGDKVILEIPTRSSVTAIAIYDKDMNVLKKGPVYLAIGQESGIISMVRIDRSDSSSSSSSSNSSGGGSSGGNSNSSSSSSTSSSSPLSYQNLWEVSADGEGRSSINCMKLFDLSNNGLQEIIVGRDNGTIAVYKFDPDEFGKAQVKKQQWLTTMMIIMMMMIRGFSFIRLFSSLFSFFSHSFLNLFSFSSHSHSYFRSLTGLHWSSLATLARRYRL